MQLRELSTSQSITERYIVNFGLKLWSDHDQGLTVWGFRLEQGDTFSYPDASKSYTDAEKPNYRFHWFIDAQALFYRVEEIEIRGKLGKWLGLQRVIARLLPGTTLTKRDMLDLLKDIPDDEEFHDKSVLVSLLDHLAPNDLVTGRELAPYLEAE